MMNVKVQPQQLPPGVEAIRIRVGVDIIPDSEDMSGMDVHETLSDYGAEVKAALHRLFPSLDEDRIEVSVSKRDGITCKIDVVSSDIDVAERVQWTCKRVEDRVYEAWVEHLANPYGEEE